MHPDVGFALLILGVGMRRPEDGISHSDTHVFFVPSANLSVLGSKSYLKLYEKN